MTVLITVENYLGTVNISNNYLVTLIEHTVSGCFGVVAINTCERQGLVGLFDKCRNVSSGVSLRYDDGRLIIGVHISVMFGTKISAVVDSLVHKIRYTIEEKTGLKIARITIFVDDMISI